MNNLVTLCAVLATAVYFVKAYDFQDSDFNELLSVEYEEGIDSLNDITQHPRARRDEEAAMGMDDKCRRRHRKPKLCCADESFELLHEKERELTKNCFKEILGVDKHDHHHRRFDFFSCEEVEKRKNDMLCVQQCIGQKKGWLAEDGTPKEEELVKYLKESFAKETWVESVADKIVSTCLTEAKNATENQPKQSSDTIKFCNPSGMSLKYCLVREFQLSCPADQIKDKVACEKFQDRIKKGMDFEGPPPHFDGPPPQLDEPKDE